MGGKKKKQTIGYKYYMGLHMGLCRGPVDAIRRIVVGDKVAWTGEIANNQSLRINRPSLFGGDEQEGGIDGTLQVMMGAPDQPRNTSLAAMLGGLVSAFRGVVTTFFDGQVCAMSPYPKEWKYLTQKTKRGWYDDDCWYPEKCEILMDDLNLRFDSLWSYLFEPAAGPHGDYSAKDYDHSAWPKGRGGFGSSITLPEMAGLSVVTSLPAGVGNTVWIRRRVNVQNNIKVTVWHDNGGWLWINGSPVALTSEGVYHSSVTLPAGEYTIAMKVTDGVPSGTPGLYAALTVQSEDVYLPIYGMNPAHILYRLYTDPIVGRGLPPSRLDSASWTQAADTFFAEGFGLCLKWSRTGSVADFAGEVINHAGAVTYTSRRTGKIVLKAIRDDYDVDDLPLFTPDSGLLGFDDDQSGAQTAGINEIVVKYYDPLQMQDAAVREKNLGSIMAAGGVTLSEEVSYPGIPTESLARRVARRDLQAKSGYIKRFTVRLDRRGADIMPGGVFRISDSLRGIENMVLRAGRVEYGTGTDGEITVTALQDVFGLPATVYREPEESGYHPPDTSVQPALASAVFELPYRELVQVMTPAELDAMAPGAGYLHAAAVRPTTLSQSFDLLTRVPPADYAEGAAMALFCPGGKLQDAIDPLETTIVLTQPTALDDLNVGTTALIGDEIVRIDAVDAETATFTIARGCVDTVPAAHAAGTPVLCYDGWGADAVTEYTDGVTVNAKLLTNTGSGQLQDAAAPELSCAFADRAARPYPPAKVQINGEYWPDAVTGDVALTWVPRNRLTQSDNVVDFYESGIAAEGGTTYTAEYYTRNGVSALDVESGITDAFATPWTPPEPGQYRIELYSVRDALQSWQRVVHRFTTADAPPEFWPEIPDDNAVLTDECDTDAAWTASGSAALSYADSWVRTTKSGSGTAVGYTTIASPITSGRDWILYCKVRMRYASGVSGYIWLRDSAETLFPASLMLGLNSSEGPALGAVSFRTQNSSGTYVRAAIATGYHYESQPLEIALQYDSKYGYVTCWVRQADGSWKYGARTLSRPTAIGKIGMAITSSSPNSSWIEVDYVMMSRPNIIAIGDSHCAGSTLFNPDPSLGRINDESTWMRHAPIYSALRNNLIVNKGVGGNTSAQILSRITDATNQAPRLVLLHASANDLPGAVSQAARTSNIQDTISACTTAGADVVLLNALYGTASHPDNPGYRDYMKDWWDTYRPGLTGVHGSIDIMQAVLDAGYLDATLAQSDKVHLTPSGYQAVGGLIAAQ